jgi:hypothetical protein
MTPDSPWMRRLTRMKSMSVALSKDELGYMKRASWDKKPS